MIYRRSIVTILSILFSLTALFAQQRGKASFYSKRATGARTSSGARVHHDSLTCAHRTYPFGSILKVTNLSNGLSVLVKVTDRGPYRRGRVIDLSWRAAKEIGMLSQGVATVEIELANTVKIPYRDETPITLPQIDFQVNDEGYSLTERWKKDTVDEATLSAKMNRKSIKQKQAVKAMKPTSTPKPTDTNKPSAKEQSLKIEKAPPRFP
ncbi:septal ring lytic transglycosylase RlpA family protein [Hoylesella marshii]|uniref:Probable endolytic peptidoglycan transglycosylase RlpA n=1 Tax=Hoylesella marshii DSM 16973 = JCM 13450 TaxID=862515 RepID=E0NVC6_9BACT|nr:septal ring lytic transglycosylase RlpA family protein [Hoylesella marshii]EFM00860.1 putative rare lipoprotein A double-psi beta-barrel protein [Hoylesella marshii DSM 16973 = JCM 13450]